MGGCYCLELLTLEYQKVILDIVDQVDRCVGTMKLSEAGWLHSRISDFAYLLALRKASGGRPVIGVNRYVDLDNSSDVELHPYDESTCERRITRLSQARRDRDNGAVAERMGKLVEAARDETRNIMPITIELVQAGAFVGGVVMKLKSLWEVHRQPAQC